MGRLRDVWRGEMPLPDLVWGWLLLGGLAVNLTATIGAFALVSSGGPWWMMVVGYGVSLPYNLLVGVGCWRAVARAPAAWMPVPVARGLIVGFLVVLSAL